VRLHETSAIADIAQLGFLTFLGIVFLACFVNLSKFGIGVILSAAAVFGPRDRVVPRKFQNVVIAIGPVRISVDGTMRTVLLAGALGLMFSGGNSLREELPKAANAAVEKVTTLRPHSPAEPSSQQDLNRTDDAGPD
jgi:hypothetical protein